MTDQNPQEQSQSPHTPGAPNDALSAPAPPPPPPMPGQAPPPGAFATAGWAPEKPSGLATLTIVLTGLYVLVQLFGSLTTQSSIDKAKEALETGETSVDAVSTLLQLVSSAVGIGAFVVLALWMARIRSNLAKRGIKAGGPPHVEWWGWFVPLANYVLPLLGMRAIANRKVGMGMLLGWWIPWCVVWMTSIAASSLTFFAIDFQTGEIANADVLDLSVPLTYIATVAVLISYAFLTAIIRRVTASHLED